MTETQLHFVLDPLLPLPWLAGLLALGLLLALWSLLHRQRGTLWRLLALLTLLAMIANPQRREEQRQLQPDIGLLLVDESASMTFDRRGDAAARAATQLMARSGPDLIWRRIAVAGAARSDLVTALTRASAAIAPERYAGALLLTDGLVHDASPSALARRPPVNVLLTGNPDVPDRRLRVLRAPAFAIIGQPANIEVMVDDAGQSPVAVRVAIPGAPDQLIQAVPGRPVAIPVILRHRGRHDIILKVAPAPGDVLPANDVALVHMQAVRERLNVLLVTGSPYPGARLWRDTLKADATIDLIHFTILRTPSSMDAAGSDELSLIPFPVEQLFEQRLGSFDLVILDRYMSLDLLQPAYFARIADYVQQGGALLVVTGPEFNGVDSLANTPLQPVLPLTPQDSAAEGRFVPALAAAGRRHPVTRDLLQPWGPWYRHARGRTVHGTNVLQTPGGDPLLTLSDIGKGRVAMLASDQLWLWARSEAPGPWNDLVRRTAHWLMKEPDLESEQLELSLRAGQLTIRHSGTDNAAAPVHLTRPDGRQAALTLTPDAGGASVTVPAAAPGLYQVRSGLLTRSLNSAADMPEFWTARPTDARLRPLAEASGGKLFWLKDGLPNAQQFSLVRNRTGQLTGLREIPLLPGWLWLLLASGALALGWLREADRLRRSHRAGVWQQ